MFLDIVKDQSSTFRNIETSM